MSGRLVLSLAVFAAVVLNLADRNYWTGFTAGVVLTWAVLRLIERLMRPNGKEKS